MLAVVFFYLSHLLEKKKMMLFQKHQWKLLRFTAHYGRDIFFNDHVTNGWSVTIKITI